MFTMEEMVEAFDIRDVNPNPARFDLKKCEAINAAHMRLLTLEDMTERRDAVPAARPGCSRDPLTPRSSASSSSRRCRWSTSGSPRSPRPPDMLGFLFVDEDEFDRDADDGPRCSTTTGWRSCGPRTRRSRRSTDWTTEAIEEALRAQLVEGLGLKPRNAFGPVRVAITGRRVSPPLFESLELLGRERAWPGWRARWHERRARAASRTADVHRPAAPAATAGLRHAGYQPPAYGAPAASRSSHRATAARLAAGRTRPAQPPATAEPRVPPDAAQWDYGWWNPLVGMLVLGALMFVIVPIVLLSRSRPGVALEVGRDVADAVRRAADASTRHPASMLYLNLGSPR